MNHFEKNEKKRKEEKSAIHGSARTCLNKMTTQSDCQKSFVSNSYLLIPVHPGSGIIGKGGNFICSIRNFPGNEVGFESIQINPINRCVQFQVLATGNGACAWLFNYAKWIDDINPPTSSSFAQKIVRMRWLATIAPSGATDVPIGILSAFFFLKYAPEKTQEECY